jgi:ParB/RepB/Spo0J family partition protein
VARVLRGEYRLIPVSEITSTTTPSRSLYEGIEGLAASIAGSDEHEGLGLLAPIAVRQSEDGRFEIIDGERRLRACQLVGRWSGNDNGLIPALVFRVDAGVARQMQLALLAHEELTPYDLARTYQALRDALGREGAPLASARGLTRLGPHGKSQIADLLRVADALTPEVLVCAGLVTADGEPTPEALVALTKKQLLDAARGTTTEERATVLRKHVEKVRSPKAPAMPVDVACTAGSPEERRNELSDSKGLTMKVRAPARMMEPSEARALIENEVAPAMLALVEQAHGGRNASGFYSAVDVGYACLVLPREVEGLTVEQLDRLDQTLTALSARTRRAREERSRIEALYVSASEVPASQTM